MVIMRSSSVNKRTSDSSSKNGTRGSLKSTKPPIPPKPVLQSHLQHGPLTNVKLDESHTTTNVSTPRYPSYPTAVLIKDEDIPYVGGNNFEYKHTTTLEALSPVVPLGFREGKFNGSLSNLSQMTLQGVLPPLTKAEITPRYTFPQPNTQIYELKTTTRSAGRPLSATAKNALLMEKMGGTIHDSSKEILPRANSNPETSSSLSVTVNRSCIISVNNFNNSYNTVNNNNNAVDEVDTSCIKKANHQRKSLNHEYPNIPMSGEITINTLPIAAPVITTTKPTVQDNGDTVTSYNNICPACIYHKRQCQCEKQENSKSSTFIVNKRKSTEDPVDTHCSGISVNGVHYEEGAQSGLQNKSDPLHTQKTSMNHEDNEFSSDKRRARLSNASSTLTLSLSAPCSPAIKPQLQKSEAFDMEDFSYYKRLSRGISRATDNVNIVSKARSEIAQGIWEAIENGHNINNTPFFIETPVFTFTLPDLSVYSDEFRSFLEKDLIEVSTLVSLEAAGRLNWWAMIGASQRFWPLATTGDGNCLLHAASLGMWGFHDRLLTLRKALHEFLTRSKFSQPLWRRWRWQLAMQNKETGLVLSQEEWEAEWESVLRLASSAPRGCSDPLANTTCSTPNLSQTLNTLSQGKLNSDVSGPVYESLEEIHVLALAHVLRRPIIVVADTTLKDMNGDPLAPIPFGGIYLPLECPPSECQRSPLLLTYDAAHFSALVIMETNEKEDGSKQSLPAVIPLSDCNHDLLPIQFLVDPGHDFLWGCDETNEYIIQKLTITNQDKKGLLSEYLDLVQVPIPSTYLEASTSSGGQEEVPISSNDPLLDVDKKSSESSFDSDDGPPFSDGGGPHFTRGNKAPKQLQTVVKSFGSLGRSMSKRIKKNLNTLSKLSRTGSFRRKNPFITKGTLTSPKTGKGVRVGTHQSFILGARIHTDERQAYQKEMIENYLSAARERFMRNSSCAPNDTVTATTSAPAAVSESRVALGDCRSTQCINPGCNLYGTAQTSYMCSSCFNRQMEREEREYPRKCVKDLSEQISGQSAATIVDGSGVGLQYGTGRSRFYAPLDENSVRSATLLPVTRSLSVQRDRTLFLSNSTFFNDASAVTASIPSYNLNRDIGREVKKSKGPPSVSSGKPSSESSLSGHSRSSSSLSDPIQSNRHGSSLVGSTKDPLAPICIDAVKVNHGKGERTSQKTKVTVRPSDQPLDYPTTVVDGNVTLSKPCLTNGCDFYGSSATEYLCSKCHVSRKKLSSGLEGCSVEQVKCIQI